LLRAARVIHPFPVGLSVAATVALASIAVDGVPAVADLARLTLAMFCVQAAIGASNDYCDRDLDAITKPFKPIVRGLVKANVALLLAALLALVAGALTARFGPLSLAVGACGLLAGLAYNFRLKRSVLSPLPFMVALPALPFWVWISLGRFANELWWLLPFGPLVGLSVHLSNTAPDLEQDRQAGVRGLAHVLGIERTLAIAWGSFAAALILAVALGFHLDYDWPLFLLGAGAAAVLLVAAIGAYALRRSQGALQLGFGLIGIATAVLAGTWLAFGGLG
jgi:4-hydroxybenzoate polyprenyltransferase